MAMTNYGKMAGSASAILGFASMFAAGIVSPIVGLGGEHTGIPMGDYNASMCSAFLIVLVWFSRERIISFRSLSSVILLEQIFFLNSFLFSS